MEQKIKDAFYNPKEGFISAKKLAQKLNVNVKTVKEILQKQETNQVFHNKPTYKRDYIPILSNPLSYQADLLFLDKYAKANGGVKSLLNIINTTTRKVYVYPIKRKTQEEIAEGFADFVEKIKGKIRMLTTDNGTEFKNKMFAKITNEYNITQYFTEEGDKKKTSRVERFNGTLRNLIYKYMLTNNTLEYMDVLDDLVYNYNNTPHTALLGKTPSNIDDDTIVDIMIKEKDKVNAVFRKMERFKIGDKVRSLNRRNLFEKGRQTYSKSVKTITSRRGFSYYLDNDESKPYKYYELLKVGDVIELKPEKKEEKQQEKTYHQKVKEVDKERKVEKEVKPLKVEQNNYEPRRSRREAQPTAAMKAYFSQK